MEVTIIPANSGLKDTLKPGESLFEYFTYTVTDVEMVLQQLHN